jgi:hypothetical protein
MILRAGLGFLLLWILGCWPGRSALPWSAGTAAARESVPVVEYTLDGTVQARLLPDGVVELGVDAGAGWRPLLRSLWPHTEGRRQELPPAFTAQAREGDPGGRRGFSRQADDDGDGQVDEDPLDGRDNDGDGLIDEDHAAISHLMGVWDQTLGERGRRLETYHWSYDHLAGLMIAVYSQHGGGLVENLRLELTESGRWQGVDEVCHQLSSTMRAPQFVARIPGQYPGDPDQWLGAAMLDLQSRQRAGTRVRVESGTLMVPLMDAHQTLALVAGPTRLRVVQDLQAAIRLQDGVVDPVTGQRVRWLPPVVQNALPADLLPEATLRQTVGQGFSLVFDVTEEHFRRWDPDLFHLDGEPLGRAVQLAWQDSEGGRTVLDWLDPGAGLADPCQPYETLKARGAGLLEIAFAGQPPAQVDQLGAVHLDGRRAELAVTLQVEAPAPAAGNGPTSTDPGRRPQLSPALLANSPNPFHHTTRISFQVPATAGEAFLVEEGQEPLFDPQQRMPYADGAASVQVTIYSLEGRELNTLYAGLAGVGFHEASWDGRDREGRTLASGTYFCKLQIDQWSVTRRIIFIR